MYNNFIATMYGPLFLGVYAVWIIAVFALTAWYRAKVCKKGGPPQLLSGNETAYDLAYLRGDKLGVFEVVLFKLFSLGVVLPQTAPVPAGLKYNHEAARKIEQPFDPLELSVVQYLKRGRPLSRIPNALNKHILEIDKRLVSRQLVLSSGQWQAMRFKSVYGIILLAGPAVYKWLAAIHAGRSNVGFLIAMLVFATIIYGLVFIAGTTDKNTGLPSVKDRRTLAGKDLLDRMRSCCSPLPLKQKKTLQANSLTNPSLLIPVALLGCSLLPDDLYPFNRAYMQATQINGYTTPTQGGTATDPGSSGGCAGGGGCGSGGCGGGSGCGGCGGGD